MGKRSTTLVALILLLFLLLSTAQAVTQRPWCDESWFFSPAVNLLTAGSMGTLNFESAGTGLLRIEKRTYWIFPLYIVAQAGWYALFGPSLFTMRAFSMFWGVLLIVSCSIIVRKLCADSGMAVVSAALIGIDYMLVHSAAEGRMDMMCAALGFAGLAAYLLLREEHLDLAVFSGSVLLAASAVTHPNAILHILGFAITVLYLDRRRVGVRHCFLAAAPYLVAGLAWTWYISADLEAFRAQIAANSKSRFLLWENPVAAIWLDIKNRYLHFVGGIGPDLAEAHRVKMVVLVGYLCGVTAMLVTPALRRRRGPFLVLLLTASYTALLSVYDVYKTPLYLVHTLPLFAMCLAISIVYAWRSAPQWRAAIGAGLVLFTLVQVGGTANVVRRNTYKHEYLPVIAFIDRNWNRNSILMGSAELTFALGFHPGIVDDPTLGAFSGKRPEMIVLEQRYEGDHRAYAARSPYKAAFVRKVLNTQHTLVFQKGPYRIYAKSGSVATASVGNERQ